MSKDIQKVIKQEVVNIADPNAIVSFANNLKKIIVDNKLYDLIKGKNYVNVEGWQIAGAYMGIVPVLKELKDLSNGAVYKYMAEVELIDQRSGNIVGRGMAICSNKEASKRSFEEYAIASMAQTRAIGKAYRSVIGWVIKMAGYEVTPAEEMSDIRLSTSEKTVVEDKTNYEELLKSANNIEELKSIFVSLPAEEKAKYAELKNQLKIKLTNKE